MPMRVPSEMANAAQVLARLQHRFPSRFLEVMEPVLKLEGGWTKGNHDGGGATMFGLTAQSHPDLASQIRRRVLPLETAIERYYNRYWKRVAVLSGVSTGLAFFLFDSYIQGAFYFSGPNGLLPIAGQLSRSNKLDQTFVSDLNFIPRAQLISALRRIYDHPELIAASINRSVMNNAIRAGEKPVNQLNGLKNRVRRRAIIALNYEGVFLES